MLDKDSVTHNLPQRCGLAWSLNTLCPRQDGRHFPDDIFLNENVWIPIKISLKFVPNDPINNIPALVQIMAWRRPGDKPLSESMMVSLPTHICVTWPQRVKFLNIYPIQVSCWILSGNLQFICIDHNFLACGAINVNWLIVEDINRWHMFIRYTTNTTRGFWQAGDEHFYFPDYIIIPLLTGLCEASTIL